MAQAVLLAETDRYDPADSIKTKKYDTRKGCVNDLAQRQAKEDELEGLRTMHLNNHHK
jgi:hypothetical protein